MGNLYHGYVKLPEGNEKSQSSNHDSSTIQNGLDFYCAQQEIRNKRRRTCALITLRMLGMIRISTLVL